MLSALGGRRCDYSDRRLVGEDGQLQEAATAIASLKTEALIAHYNVFLLEHRLGLCLASVDFRKLAGALAENLIRGSRLTQAITAITAHNGIIALF